MLASLDHEVAVLYGQFVNAAYAMFESDEKNLAPPPKGLPGGWNLVAWITMADFLGGDLEPKFYGFIAQSATNSDSFVLAIRGTEGLIEWWDDAHFASVLFMQVPNAGRVAQGFDTIYDTLKVTVRGAAHAMMATEALPGTFAEQVALAMRAHVPARQPGLEAMDLTMPTVAVAGHSLGAALCTLYVMENAAKKIVSNPTVCTFASPRVGNQAFVQAFNALGLTSWRIVNAPDVVPNLPPDIFGYAHVNVLELFDSTGLAKSTIACAHAMDTYLALLDSSLKPDADCAPETADQAMAARLPGERAAVEARARILAVSAASTQGPALIASQAATQTADGLRILQIAVINESTGIADGDVQSYLAAFAQQWNSDLIIVWPVLPSQLAFVPKGTAPGPAMWWVVFLDDSDQANALAYHDLTNDGLPISKVFVKTLQAEKASISVGATHEICEMAVDPWLNSAYQDPQGTFWAGEVCDPVEADEYGYEINGVLVTDFVTPNWFAHKNAQGAIDFKGHAQSQFQVLSGGYAQKYDQPTSSWQQVNGDKALASAMVASAPPGSRRERRRRGSGSWQRSAVRFVGR
jgi:hypothetical protein